MPPLRLIRTNATIRFQTKSGSRAWWRRKSTASSASPQPLEPSRKPRKVSKTERHAMVEAFVQKYRSANAGKFPTNRCAMKHVGGSFYTIREIIQKIQHDHKTSSLSSKGEFSPGTSDPTIDIDNSVHVKEQYPSSDAKEVPNDSKSTSSTFPEKSVDVEATFVTTNNIRRDETPSAEAEVSTSEPSEISIAEASSVSTDKFKRADPSFVGAEGSSVLPTEHGNMSSSKSDNGHNHTSGTCIVEQSVSSLKVNSSVCRDMSNHRKEPISLSGLSEKHRLPLEIEPKKADASDIKASKTDASDLKASEEGESTGDQHDGGGQIQHRIHSESSEEVRHEEDSPKNTTMWSNIKSIANDIISFWRKT